ncbi:MAG: DUF6171 family protein [Clostridiales bacterium]|jgi:hypothetical protein|nr:DUF6171 family protein [Clostridiales bacterium]
MKAECIRCLLHEMTYDAANIVAAYVEALPEEMKAEPALVQKRLAACKRCECLIGGICRLCGCFVEARAAKKSLKCPMSENIWQ